MNLADLGARLPQIVERVRAEEDGVVGVAAFGSYERGEAAASSDLDLEAVLHREPRVPYRTLFDGDLHVSVGFDSFAGLEQKLREPADWSLGLPTTLPGRWLWAEDSAKARLGDPPDFSRPPGDSELEDFVEYCAKALRATGSLALRLAAQGAGREAAVLLRDLNDAPPASGRADAVRIAAGYAVAPEAWPEDLLTLLGLTAADDRRVRLGVERVARGVLRLLREHRAEPAQPYLDEYLADGTLERHLGLASSTGPTESAVDR